MKDKMTCFKWRILLFVLAPCVFLITVIGMIQDLICISNIETLSDFFMNISFILLFYVLIGQFILDIKEAK